MTSLGQATSIHRRVSVDRTRSFAVATFPDAQAIDAQLDGIVRIVGDDPALVICFVSPSLARTDLLGALESLAPGVPMIGCTTSGIVEPHGNFGAALQLLVLGGSGFDARTALGDYTTLGSREAGRLVGGAVPAHVDGSNRALLLLSDGLGGDVAEVVRGAYGAAGAGVSIVGGCAGDDLAMERTCQFAGQHQLQSGVAAAALTSTGPIGIGVEHGWTPVGEPMVVTESDGTSIVALDDRPAMDMYLDAVGRDHSIIDSASFARFAQTRPLGLTDNAAGQVRFVTGGDLDRRTLDFLVHVPVGSLVWVMEGSRASVVDATRVAGEQAVAKLEGLDPIGVVAFDCVARRSVIGDSLVFEETYALASTLPEGTPMAGFYTYGEIARTGGALGLHHQTMVVLALG